VTRPSWDDTWLAVAEVVSRRSPCGRGRVGAVAVGPDNRYSVVGYNGPPAGTPVQFCPREHDGPKEACLALHAEANALLQADRTRLAGGTVYVTRAPCRPCVLLVANSGASRLVFVVTEDDEGHYRESARLAMELGLSVHSPGQAAGWALPR
jgi:dCMP deaminase